MGLFGRDDKNPQPSQVSGAAVPRSASPSPGPHHSSTTLVAGSSSIEGKLVGSDDLHVEGVITGEVRSAGHLVIAESGRAKAHLHARVVTVAGSVEGDVSADDRIELLPSARLTGNITAPRVIIQEGATFDGQVFMKKTTGASSAGAKNPSTETAASRSTPQPESATSGPEDASEPSAGAPGTGRKDQGNGKHRR